jgi:phytanoyl-CoA hydroxylase
MLTPDRLSEFNEKGFIVLRGLVCAELDEVEQELLIRLDELAGYLGVDFEYGCTSLDCKMMALEQSRPGASLTFAHSHIIGPRLLDLWSSPRLLDAAQSILGSDIDGHPFLAVRPKPPEIDLFVVPWHQDSAYLAAGAQGTQQITFWIPLLKATAENGCLEMARGAHLSGEKSHVLHEYEELGNSSWYVEIDPTIVTGFDKEICEVERGDAIMFTHLTPHRSLPNCSSTCRWSIDLRYMQAGCFSGSNSAPVPLRRSDAALNQMVEQSKENFRRAQASKDRNLWRHRMQVASWKDRWK